MKLLFALTIGVLATTSPGRVAAAPAEWAIREVDSSEQSLRFSAPSARRLEIDNVFGSIDVLAHDGSTVDISVTTTWKARSAEALEAARREATLDVTEEGALIRLYANGPFRDCCNQSWRRRREPGYIVQYDILVLVPRDAHVDASTVNDGHIRISGVRGGYSVHNVNGSIEMIDVAGAGEVKTVNDDIDVMYAEEPRALSSFSSVNGNLTVMFPRALAADLRLKTFNGSIYTDFDTSTIAARPPVAERRGATFVYKTDRSIGLRVGAGGPELGFETLNGDIRILDRGTR